MATPEAALVHLTADQIKDMIADAIKADRQASTREIGESMGAAVAAGMAKHTRPKVTYGEYARRAHSTTHPNPDFPNGPALLRETWINGHREEQAVLHDDEIDLFNRISRSGRFLNRLWEVQVSSDAVEIRYNNKTSDQRNELARHGDQNGLAKVVAEMDALNAVDADEVEEKVEMRRRFGRGKATQSAYAKAEA